MKVLLIDDHKLVRDALIAFLEHVRPDMEVEESGTLQEALALLSESSGIELVLLDLSMPDTKGLEGLDILRTRYPEIPIVVLSATSDTETILEAIKQGAVGYIPKNLSGRVMVRAVELVLAGERFIPSKVVDEESNASGGSDAGLHEDTGLEKMFAQLTPRQRQVLELLILGKANKEISNALGIKEITVGYHLKGLFQKFGVANRTQVVATALQMGWKV